MAGGVRLRGGAVSQVNVAAEREKFEVYAKRKMIPLDKFRHGDYRAFQARDSWDGWLARAQLELDEKESPPGGSTGGQ